MGKAESKKLIKREALLNTAFHLFTTKGINNTSISDIVEKAGVAKGTFYLYFKDKYDINNKLVAHRSTQLVEAALEALKNSELKGDYKDKILFVVNHIIDALTEDKILLMFISKNLGLGFFRFAMENYDNSESFTLHSAVEQLLIDTEDTIENPKLMMYMIIELTGSSIYSSILYGEPVSIEELKPYLYKAIHNLMDQFTIKHTN